MQDKRAQHYDCQGLLSFDKYYFRMIFDTGTLDWCFDSKVNNFDSNSSSSITNSNSFCLSVRGGFEIIFCVIIFS